MSRTAEFEQLLADVRREIEHLGDVDTTISTVDVVGQSTDRLVAVSVRGAGEISAVRIHPNAMERHDADSLGLAVMQAVSDALGQAHGLLAEAHPDIFGELLPADDEVSLTAHPLATEAWDRAS